DLERVEILHDIDDAEKVCGCGQNLVRIGEETNEKLDIIPQKMIVQRHVRPKYACKHCEGSGDENRPAVRIAPPPLQLLPKSIATPGLLAFILTSKFEDALPLHRQEKIFARHGIELSRQTMSNWVLEIGAKVQPLMDLLKRELLAGPVIGADETTFQVLKEPGRSDTTKSYMWVMRGRAGPSGKPVLLFEYRPTRSATFLKDMFADFRGVLQSDGFSGYESAISTMAHITHAGCWAHARRKFFDAQKNNPDSDTLRLILEMIGKLYAVESEARERELKAREIRKLRQRESASVLNELKRSLDEIAPAIRPQSETGKAIAYTLNQWERLRIFLNDGNVPIDNNGVENKIRPFVIGRKNWLFAGSPNGAHASAAIYTLIENAKANGIEPYRYLRYLFENLAHARSEQEIRELLPQSLDAEGVGFV
ncbi:MAG TPA: IS66 family transposase, partial [Planctomycetaceae bacterium]|nr:IS66 family transposase [Planctomycetaceae bacterium]